jgi:predicted TIM-barrel fold metal-dependent hydrolase
MSRSASRREFLAASAGTALAGLAPTAAASAPGPPIIDTHVYLWDLKTSHLAWLEGAPALNRGFLWDDYRKASAGLSIVKTIYMEVDVDADVFSSDLTQWKRGIAAVARRPDACCKISGIVASTRGHVWRAADLAPIIKHVLSEFGPDRVVFGGDWPVCTLGAPLATWLQALREVVRDRTPDDQRKLFHDNATQVYGLH